MGATKKKQKEEKPLEFNLNKFDLLKSEVFGKDVLFIQEIQKAVDDIVEGDDKASILPKLIEGNKNIYRLLNILKRAYDTKQARIDSQNDRETGFINKSFHFVIDIPSKITGLFDRNKKKKKAIYPNDVAGGDLENLKSQLLKILDNDNLIALKGAKSAGNKDVDNRITILRKTIFNNIEKLVKDNASAKSDFKEDYDIYEREFAPKGALLGKASYNRTNTTVTTITSVLGLLATSKLVSDYINPVVQAPRGFISHIKSFFAGEFTLKDIFLNRGRGKELNIKMLNSVLFVFTVAAGIFSIMKIYQTISDSTDKISDTNKNLIARKQSRKLPTSLELPKDLQTAKEEMEKVKKDQVALTA